MDDKELDAIERNVADYGPLFMGYEVPGLVAAQRDEARAKVKRLAADLLVQRRATAHGEAALDRANALLRYALHLRINGERAPGGNETWAQFDRDCDEYLRTTDGGPMTPEQLAEDETAHERTCVWCETEYPCGWKRSMDALREVWAEAERYRTDVAAYINERGGAEWRALRYRAEKAEAEVERLRSELMDGPTWDAVALLRSALVVALRRAEQAEAALDRVRALRVAMTVTDPSGPVEYVRRDDIIAAIEGES